MVMCVGCSIYLWMSIITRLISVCNVYAPGYSVYMSISFMLNLLMCAMLMPLDFQSKLHGLCASHHLLPTFSYTRTQTHIIDTKVKINDSFVNQFFR